MDMIENINIATIWSGESCDETTWFYPKVSMHHSQNGDEAIMACQPIYSGGGDLFGPVHWSVSKDGGENWSKPEPIAGLNRQVLKNGIEKGVCDVVPEYHSQSNVVLAAGTTVFYKDGKLFVDHPSMNLQRGIEYVVYTPEGTWLEPRTLRWKGPEAYYTYSCGCSQRLNLETGEVIIPVTFALLGRRDRFVSSLLCSFDGQNVERRVGNFHITNFSKKESWVTATESLPLGRTLLARIKWK